MRVLDRHRFHGIALAQIAEYPGFKGLISEVKQGHYIVNGNRRLLLKYAAGDAPPWAFNFSQDDQETLVVDAVAGSRTIVVGLVCGTSYVCPLDAAALVELINPMPGPPQIAVTVRPGSGSLMHVRWGASGHEVVVDSETFPACLLDP